MDLISFYFNLPWGMGKRGQKSDQFSPVPKDKASAVEMEARNVCSKQKYD